MGSLETWGAIAATLLIIECMVGMTALVALSFGLWKGAGWIVKNATRGFEIVDERVEQAQELLITYQRKVVTPFVQARGAAAGLLAGWRAFWRRRPY